MDFDPFRIKNVKKETKTELLRWKSQSKPSTPQHIAANVELIRRDDQMRSRLWMGFAIVAVSLVVAAVFWSR